MLTAQQENIARKIEEEGSQSLWNDWRWQLKHSIQDLASFERLSGIRFGDAEREALEKTLARFPLSITPYYLSLIEIDDYENDPIFKQAFPSVDELILQRGESADPLHEDEDSPAPCITHRYPDRVLFQVSNTCSMYCRHCTRKRKVGDCEYIPDRATLQQGIDYIRRSQRVRDVLLSGGDPLMLSNDYLDWILGEISAIPHVELIRIGSRMPVVLPYRVTDKLVNVIKRHHPVWLNTHFNHPREITRSSREALSKLADAGIPLGNQSVLLRDVNDCPRIIRSLVHKLTANRVRPYYLYQCDLSEGLSHFRTPVGKGIEIIESLIGHTSGFAVPTYVIDAPGGGGKIPVMPNYLISWSATKVVLRNYEGVISTYQEPEAYPATYCDRRCEECHLQLKLDDAAESKAVGIEGLLCDWDEISSLVPAENQRMERRDE